MAKKGSDNSWWADHLLRLNQYSGRVTRIYNKYVDEFTKLAGSLNIDPKKPFSFDDYPQTKENITKAMQKIVEEVKIEIDRGTREEWLESSNKNDSLVDRILLSSGIPREKLEQFYNHNLEALGTFQNRKDGTGLGLSDKIWNYTEQYKQEIELSIDTALGDGRPATKLSGDVRNYLKEPNKLFRRVRDRRGNLVLSKHAKAYNPGRGTYRSSYKNAMRLAVSEINMAYKESDQTRWEQLPFVIGYEIKLSGNHPKPDICDDLKGQYPKTFKFKGWHPFCRCYVISLLCTDAERQRLQIMILNGEDLSKFSPSGVVRDVPDGFKQWVKANAERAKEWNSTPYFIRDNFKQGQLSKGLDLKIPGGQKTSAPEIKPPVIEKTPVKAQKETKREILPDPPSKSIEEAENRIKQRFPGMIVDYSGFKKADIPIIDEIRRSADYHFTQFPEIESKVKYLGTISNKYERIQKIYFDEYKKLNLGSYFSDPNTRDMYIRESIRKNKNVKSRSPRANAGSYAFSDPWDKGGLNGICWNDKFGLSKITESLKRDVSAKYHPPGCNTPKSVIDHELGHKVDELLDLRKDPEFKKIFNDAVEKGRDYIYENLSRYAWDGKNPVAEFIAEAWSEYLNNPTPRDIAKTVGDLILKKYKLKYPRSAK